MCQLPYSSPRSHQPPSSAHFPGPCSLRGHHRPPTLPLLLQPNWTDVSTSPCLPENSLPLVVEERCFSFWFFFLCPSFLSFSAGSSSPSIVARIPSSALFMFPSAHVCPPVLFCYVETCFSNLNHISHLKKVMKKASPPQDTQWIAPLANTFLISPKWLLKKGPL